MSAFARLPPRLQEAIVSRLGWTSLRPVQEEAVGVILDGMNAVVLAPTAGGKTEAAIFPVLAGLMEREPGAVGALYVAPLKALLNNQEDRLGTYTEMVGLRRFVWHGDAKESDKRRFIKEPAQLLMLTPESMEVMLLSSRVPAARLFKDLRYVVVDEVHAFAGTDRGAHLMSVIERLVRFTNNDVLRVGLSATVGNPSDILAWLRGTSKREGRVVNPPKEPARRELLVTMNEGASDVARQAARMAEGKKSLFFCQSRSMAESVAAGMRGRGIEVFVHHSSVSREERQAAEERFHGGTNACIVCTSTLELGIDIGDLNCVFQENAPSTVSSFLQRMGRTGRRAESASNTTFFCENAEAVLQAVALIELAKSQWIESIPDQTRCWPVLVHQLLAMTLQFGAITVARCWEQISVVPDFRGIERSEFDAVVEHMTRNEFLFESGGQLSMGERAERVFGKKNFMELYAVFSSPIMYRVETEAGRNLGSLEQDYVDRLVEEMTSFLLGGRPWTVEHINHGDKVVRVRPAPRGQKPSWGGYIPQHLSFEVCQRIREILVSEDVSYPYLDTAAQAVIGHTREDLAEVLRRSGHSIQLDGSTARWWTFAGGRINHTLKYALEWLNGWKVVPDNFVLRIQGDGLSNETVRAAIASMSRLGFWKSAETRSAILARIPAYRLSKFQQALPDWAAEEMVGAYLLDFDATQSFLQAGD